MQCGGGLGSEGTGHPSSLAQCAMVQEHTRRGGGATACEQLRVWLGGREPRPQYTVPFRLGLPDPTSPLARAIGLQPLEAKAFVLVTLGRPESGRLCRAPIEKCMGRMLRMIEVCRSVRPHISLWGWGNEEPPPRRAEPASEQRSAAPHPSFLLL